MIVPNHGVERTGGNALHAAPAAAHINKRGFVAIQAAESVAATHISCQAFIANLAKIIYYFEHQGACGSLCHSCNLRQIRLTGHEKERLIVEVFIVRAQAFGVIVLADINDFIGAGDDF